MAKIGEPALFKNGSRFKVLVVIGIFAFLAGLILQWYPTYVISGLHDSLKQPNLKIEDIWRIGGSLDWWNSSFITVFQPLSTLLFVTSIILFGYVTVYLLSGLLVKLRH